MGAHYYSLDFNYHPGPYVGMPGEDEASKKASSAHFAADDLVHQQAKKSQVAIRHAYGWPDGSLYKYVRTSHSREEIQEIFEVDPTEGQRITLRVTVREMPLSDVQRISASGPVTIEERFQFDFNDDDDRERYNDLVAARYAEEKALQKPYQDARDACEICVPGKMACKACSAVLKETNKAVDEWRNKPRPWADEDNKR
jgi:hypothetical protein